MFTIFFIYSFIFISLIQAREEEFSNYPVIKQDITINEAQQNNENIQKLACAFLKNQRFIDCFITREPIRFNPLEYYLCKQYSYFDRG